MDIRDALMNGLDHFFETNPPKIDGVGVCKLPNLEVPQMEKGDAERIAKDDYLILDNIGKAWIRRAMVAETFSKALEKELEKLRVNK